MHAENNEASEGAPDSFFTLLDNNYYKDDGDSSRPTATGWKMG
jgi:hypothetical protein